MPPPKKNADIRFVVEDYKKERWEAAVSDHPAASSLSGLIRHAVDEYIEDGTIQSDHRNDEIIENQGQILNVIQRIDKQIQTLDSRIDLIEDELFADSQIAQLKNEVFTLLPDEDQFERFWAFAENAPDGTPLHVMPDTDPKQIDAVHSGNVEIIANAVGEPEYRIAEVIESLQQDTARIRTETKRDTICYYRDI